MSGTASGIKGLITGDPEKELGEAITEAAASPNPSAAIYNTVTDKMFNNRASQFQAKPEVYAPIVRAVVNPGLAVRDSVIWEPQAAIENSSQPIYKEVKACFGEHARRGTNFGIRCTLVVKGVEEWKVEAENEAWMQLLRNSPEEGPSLADVDDFMRNERSDIHEKEEAMIDGVMDALLNKVKSKPKEPKDKQDTSVDPNEAGMEIADASDATGEQGATTNDDTEQTTADTGQGATGKKPKKNAPTWNHAHADGFARILEMHGPRDPSSIYAATIEYTHFGECVNRFSAQSGKIVSDWSDKNNLKTNDTDPMSYEHSKNILLEYSRIPGELKELKLVRSVYAAALECAKKTRPLYLSKDQQFFENELEEPSAKRMRLGLAVDSDDE